MMEKLKNLRRYLLAGLCFLVGWGVQEASPQQERWDSIQKEIEQKFPQVKQLKVDELEDWLADSKRTAPLLIDVREETEFAVSHLKGARRVQPGILPTKQLQDVPKDTPIVLYCSVGYRSSHAATMLQKAGYTNVQNLEGSIFAWANKGHSVYLEEKTVTEVHPYNLEWGVLLDSKYHPSK